MGSMRGNVELWTRVCPAQMNPFGPRFPHLPNEIANSYCLRLLGGCHMHSRLAHCRMLRNWPYFPLQSYNTPLPHPSTWVSCLFIHVHTSLTRTLHLFLLVWVLPNHHLHHEANFRPAPHTPQTSQGLQHRCLNVCHGPPPLSRAPSTGWP